MNISHRKLGPNDSAQYRKIRLESLKTHPESFGSTFEEQSKLPKLMFEGAIDKPVDERFIIGSFDQTELIGICGFIPFVPNSNQNYRNTGIIIQMFVKATYSGRRIGLSLIKTTICEAFKISDIEQIVLAVKKENMSAIRVYEQAGFTIYNSVGKKMESSEDGLQNMVIYRDE